MRHCFAWGTLSWIQWGTGEMSFRDNGSDMDCSESLGLSDLKGLF